MANRAYASIWTRDFSEDALLQRWGDFLETVPFSLERPGFAGLVIRAVEASEAPLIEQDLRSGEPNGETLIRMASEHIHPDCCYETRAYWDLWTFDSRGRQWERKPQTLLIFCRGEQFEEGVWLESGHFLVDIGLEHFFTGHANLLGFDHVPAEKVTHPEEARFVQWMSNPENLSVYYGKTRENIGKLYAWIRRVEEKIPVERYRLWSEGEENFEARMEEILAAR